MALLESHSYQVSYHQKLNLHMVQALTERLVDPSYYHSLGYILKVQVITAYQLFCTVHQFHSLKAIDVENLNNIILENNVIGSSFKKNIPSTENKQEISKKITDQQEVIEKVFKKTTSLEKPKKPEEMDILTKKIFGKE